MNAQETILLIDDDQTLTDFMADSLNLSGYETVSARSGQSGLRQLFQHQPSMVILDVNMPGMDGWTTCERIREVSDVPIIMLTADMSPDSIVKGLDLGADDYLVKPFEMDVLLARIRANLRRRQAETAVVRDAVEYSDAFLTINLEERRVTKDGEPLKLTKTEFDLLAELVQTAPRIATYRQLLENVWGFEYIDDIDYLRVYIWHLRRKIERDSKNPEYVLNEQGVGYRFNTA